MAFLDPYAGAWTASEAAHLARRAGFGATPTEVSSLVTAGMDAAVDSLVDYSPVDVTLDALIASLPSTGDLGAVQNPVGVSAGIGWWVYRMVHTTQPLQEQFTLFLHDTLVSEFSKVSSYVSNNSSLGNDGSTVGQTCTTGTLAPDPLRKNTILTRLMRDQNDLYRTTGHLSYRNLLLNITHDPAMLYYLDNAQNIKGKAQENYAREIMELFSMGVGNYSEQDVKEIARALTGETVDGLCANDWPYTYIFSSLLHDTNTKTVFGTTFNDAGAGQDGVQVIDLIVNRISNSGITPAHATLPATSIYMSWKFINWFVLETIPIDHAAVAELAGYFYTNMTNGYFYDVRETLRKLFKSQFFYDSTYRYRMIKHPADFVVMTLRNLGLEEASYTSSLPFYMKGMGMTLFAPPNVAGWNHGVAWINSGNLINRFNYGNRLSQTAIMTDAYCDALIPNGDVAGQNDDAGIIEYFRARLIQTVLRPEEITILSNFLTSIGDSTASIARYRRKVRGIAHLMMTLPQYQLK